MRSGSYNERVDCWQSHCVSNQHDTSFEAITLKKIHSGLGVRTLSIIQKSVLKSHRVAECMLDV